MCTSQCRCEPKAYPSAPCRAIGSPACFKNPLHDLDPLLQARWLSRIAELRNRIEGLRESPGAFLGAWIKRIAANKCLAHLRSGWKLKRDDGFDLDQFLTRTLTIVSTVVTLLVAIDRM